MKALLATFLIFISGSQVLAQSELPFSCLTPADIAAADSDHSFYSTLKSYAQQILHEHPAVATNIIVGRCRNLPKTSVLHLTYRRMYDLPEKCVGLTFLGITAVDTLLKAQITVKTQSKWIDGESGAAIVELGGAKIKVPICAESFTAVGFR